MKKLLLILTTLLLYSPYPSFAVSHDKTVQAAIDNIITSEAQKIKQIQKKHYTRTDWSKKLKLDNIQEQQVLSIYQNSHMNVMKLIKKINLLEKQIAEQYAADDEKIKQLLNSQQSFQFEKFQRQKLRNSGIKPEGEKPSRKKMRPVNVY